ncbi:hypothetical protein MIZ03_3193 [Rhodoferax lithotrophicus]|uniref:Uncharacterized protein n=1 Tax=Rhodoferax lithotrophicus TaxID=2798804 RepID=A0ABN6D970_9BURK|nr:hypothetical protein MIZ03_3193 [Rhodoferax sp. MIZ03]
MPVGTPLSCFDRHHPPLEGISQVTIIGLPEYHAIGMPA